MLYDNSERSTNSVAATATVVAIRLEDFVSCRDALVVAPDGFLAGTLAFLALALLPALAGDSAFAAVLVAVLEPIVVAALTSTPLPDLAVLAVVVRAVVIVVPDSNRGNNALHEQEPGEDMKKLHDGSSSRLTSNIEVEQTRVLNSSKRARVLREGMRREKVEPEEERIKKIRRWANEIEILIVRTGEP